MVILGAHTTCSTVTSSPLAQDGQPALRRLQRVADRGRCGDGPLDDLAHGSGRSLSSPGTQRQSSMNWSTSNMRQIDRTTRSSVGRDSLPAGEGIIVADGSLDRAGLAAIASTDDQSVAALNAIMHPAVRAEIRRQIESHADTDHVVVLDTPFDDRDGDEGSRLRRGDRRRHADRGGRRAARRPAAVCPWRTRSARSASRSRVKSPSRDIHRHRQRRRCRQPRRRRGRSLGPLEGPSRRGPAVAS